MKPRHTLTESALMEILKDMIQKQEIMYMAISPKETRKDSSAESFFGQSTHIHLFTANVFTGNPGKLQPLAAQTIHAYSRVLDSIE